MWDYMERRARSCAEYILSTGATVRACANHFGISKSTVHKDVAERLKDSDAELYAAVRKVLDKNLSERHIRGELPRATNTGAKNRAARMRPAASAPARKIPAIAAPRAVALTVQTIAAT